MIEAPEIGMTFRLQDLSEVAFVATEGMAGTVADMVQRKADLFYYHHVRISRNIFNRKENFQLPISLSGITDRCLNLSAEDDEVVVSSEFFEVDWLAAVRDGEVTLVGSDLENFNQNRFLEKMLEGFEYSNQGLLPVNELRSDVAFDLVSFLFHHSDDWARRPQRYFKGGTMHKK